MPSKPIAELKAELHELDRILRKLLSERPDSSGASGTAGGRAEQLRKRRQEIAAELEAMGVRLDGMHEDPDTEKGGKV